MKSTNVYTHLDLFAGIGGFSLAASYFPIVTTDMVECDAFCQSVLRKHFPKANIYDDICSYEPRKHSHDFITAGFPCQDVSLANRNRVGITGDRSSLFFRAWEIITEIEPRGFIFENVYGVYKYLPEILLCIAKSRMYEVRWFNLRLDWLGGCHRRNRWFLFGVAPNTFSNPRTLTWNKSNQQKQHKSLERCATRKIEKNRLGELPVCDQNDGIPAGLARDLMGYEEAIADIDNAIIDKSLCTFLDKKKLKALGNAVTPQQAYIAFSIMLKFMN